jgi:hypothetical protein
LIRESVSYRHLTVKAKPQITHAYTNAEEKKLKIISVSRWLESNLSKPWVQDAMKNVLTNRGTAITTANRDKGDNRPV